MVVLVGITLFYLCCYLVFVLKNTVPSGMINSEMVRDGVSVVNYGDQNGMINRTIFYVFYPIQFLSYHVFKCDAEVRRGDSFWYEFTGDKYIN